MNLEVIDRLFRIGPSGVKPGLDVAHALNKALAFPTTSYFTIHVAGSNGKGSVTTKIAKVLELSGYRVGLYTSPHIVSFSERMTVNGIPISESAIGEGLERLFSFADQLRLKPSFFEFTTLLAFDYFRRQKIDVAVIETGLGGRWDATNIVHPLLSIITSISRDHTQLLGETLELIAGEKAGILKEKVPVVLGPRARVQPIYTRAEELSCPVFTVKKISQFYDEENSAIAQLAMECLASHFSISSQALMEGLSIRPPCRFEKIGNAIFDVAHNPDAVFYLLQALHTFYPEAKFRFVAGFCKDKEYATCLALIADVATHIHLVQAPISRAANLEELKASIEKEDLALCTFHPILREAVQLADSLASEKGEILVVCGSFYIMAEAKEALQAPKECVLGNACTLPSAFSSSIT
jgi:dihydrofolate synthase/folylpolyglutamate synthase